MLRHQKLMAAIAAGIFVVGAFSTGAAATESNDAGESHRVLSVEVDGVLTPLSEVMSFPSLDMEEPSSAEGDIVTPQLIDFTQWVGCFTLNWENDEYAWFTWFKDGYGHDVTLKCGTHNDLTRQGWGYKHIRGNHESQWQHVYDEFIDLGWNWAVDGIEGWDDLMVAGTGHAITFWTYNSPIKPNNTVCVMGRLWLVEYPASGPPVPIGSVKTAAVFAIDSDRLITSYPTEALTC